jgi:hypothetical protein
MFLEQVIADQPFKKFPGFTESDGPSPRSYEPVTGPYPEEFKSNPRRVSPKSILMISTHPRLGHLSDSFT